MLVKSNVLSLIVVLLLFGSAPAANSVNALEGMYPVSDFGAKGDGQNLETEALQRAIDACHQGGGGRVLVTPGKYLIAGLQLKTNVTLEISAGAILLGSAQRDDYAVRAVIRCEGQNNAAIVGRGVIDGQGGHPLLKPPNPYNGLPGRPYLIHATGSSGLRVRGITLRNAATWAFRCDECDDVVIDDLTIRSRVNANNDGVDLVDCRRARVTNCDLDCGDDAICLKSETKRGCQYVTIANCVVKSESNGIKFGTASVGGFRDIVISNCTVYDTRLSGLALEAVDGGSIDRVAISNITMNNVNGGIFLRLGQRHCDVPGVLKNVTISNVLATGVGSWRPDTSAPYFKETRDPRIGLSLAGLPGHCIENVTLRDVRIRFHGGGSVDNAALDLEEKPATYPEYSMFGVTPAYGFNCRHVRSVDLLNVILEWENMDARPAVFFDDAADITLANFDAAASPKARALVRLRNVNGFFAYGCRPRAAQTAFLSLEGASNDRISIIGNDFSRLQSVIRTKPEGLRDADALFEAANR